MEQEVTEGLSVKPPVEETTVIGNATVAVTVPEVPVMVAVEVPTVAVALAAHVNALVEVVEFGESVQVTPEGRPVMASVTLPEKPPPSVIVMVSDADLP
jgi:hypothetical protein